MGDGRIYKYVAALHAVQIGDFMAAHWAELPYTLLGRISHRIVYEVRGINCFVYVVSSKRQRAFGTSEHLMAQKTAKPTWRLILA